MEDLLKKITLKAMNHYGWFIDSTGFVRKQIDSTEHNTSLILKTVYL